MPAKPLLLLLGVGPRTGGPIAKHFAQNGYQVAVASRSGSGKKDEDGILALKADFSQTSSIPAAFEAAKAEFGTSPSVVVYNASASTPPSDPKSLFSISTEQFATDLNISTVSAYEAARQTVEGWKSLSQDAKKVFIFTGNILNIKHLPIPALTTLGVGKAASAFWIGTADAQFAPQGSRFFYADERTATGDSVGADINGKAHAEFYTELAAGGEGIPWLATFVRNRGYVKFE